MLDLRKLPLIHACVPLIAGMLFSFYSHWSVSVLILIALGVFITGWLGYVYLRKQSGHLAARLVFLTSVWCGLGIAGFAIHDFRKDAGNIAAVAGKEVLLAGEIREVKPGKGGRSQLLLEVEKVCIGDSVRPLHGKIVVMLSENEKHLRCGDLVVTGGELLKVKRSGNPGEFDAVSFYRSRKIGAMMFASSAAVERYDHRNNVNTILTDWRDFLSRKMEQELSGTFLAIAKALILGDKSDLDADTMEAFSATGSMHVLAVSGLHIGLILMLLQKLLLVFSRWISKRSSILIALVLIWIYGGITGASPAVMRAVVMFTALSAGQLFYRRSESLNILALSALVLLCVDPWWLFDLGFQLSYLALIGIFILYKPILRLWTPGLKWIRMGWEGTAAGLAATILTTPLILFWFYRFPNYFAMANIGVMIWGFAVLLMGMVFLITAWIPYVVKMAAFLFAVSIYGLVAWVEWVEKIPGAVSGGFQLPAWQIMVAYILIGCWIVHVSVKKLNIRFLASLTCALLLGWTVQRWYVLQSRELVIFNSNQFVAAVKSGNRIYGFYDKKWTGSWQLPRELDAFAKYTGCALKIIPLHADKTELKAGNQHIRIRKERDGIRFTLNDHAYFYRTNGIPNADENPALMTTRMQLYARPDATTRPYRKSL